MTTAESQPAPTHDIGAVLSDFNLGTSLEKPQKLDEGIANHNFAVRTDTGVYVIKFLVEQSQHGIENDIAIQRQLREAGIVTPSYLQNSEDGYIFSKNGILAVVSKKIEGKVPTEIAEPLCVAMGEMLGRFHTSVHFLTHPHKGWLNPEIAKEFPAVETNETTVAAEALLDEGIAIYTQDLPHGIIHGDFHEGNLLVSPEDQSSISAIMDFEESEENLFIVDLARTSIGVCTSDNGTKLDPALIKSLIDGYENVRKLTDSEREGLRLAVKYVAGAGALWLFNHGHTEYAEQYVQRAKSLEDITIS